MESMRNDLPLLYFSCKRHSQPDKNPRWIQQRVFPNPDDTPALPFQQTGNLPITLPVP
jgi:hypothetical protein